MLTGHGFNTATTYALSFGRGVKSQPAMPDSSTHVTFRIPSWPHEASTVTVSVDGVPFIGTSSHDKTFTFVEGWSHSSGNEGSHRAAPP